MKLSLHSSLCCLLYNPSRCFTNMSVPCQSHPNTNKWRIIWSDSSNSTDTGRMTDTHVTLSGQTVGYISSTVQWSACYICGPPKVDISPKVDINHVLGQAGQWSPCQETDAGPDIGYIGRWIYFDNSLYSDSSPMVITCHWAPSFDVHRSRSAKTL